jgi:sugar/nucleoside kinase (ribokinase family)
MGVGVARQCSRNRCLARWTVWIPHRGRGGAAGRANSKKDLLTGRIRVSVPSGLRDLLPLTDVFLPNVAEATRITGIDRVDDAVLAIADHAGLVVAKAGADGAIAAQGDRIVRAPAPRVDPVDATSAGDAFDAGFLASRLAGDPLACSLAIPNACGAISTRTLRGVDAQPTMDEALAFLGET